MVAPARPESHHFTRVSPGIGSAVHRLAFIAPTVTVVSPSMPCIPVSSREGPAIAALDTRNIQLAGLIDVVVMLPASSCLSPAGSAL